MEAHLEQQLVLGYPLHRFQQVGVEAQLVIQLLLALLQPPNTWSCKAMALPKATGKEKQEGEGLGTNLEEGTVGALSPQALGAWLVLTVLLIDLELLHLQPGGTKGTDPRAETAAGRPTPPVRLAVHQYRASYSNPLTADHSQPREGEGELYQEVACSKICLFT